MLNFLGSRRTFTRHEKHVTRRDGFLYQFVTVEHQRECKFGLGIKHYQNKVIVSRVNDGEFIFNFFMRLVNGVVELRMVWSPKSNKLEKAL